MPAKKAKVPASIFSELAILADLPGEVRVTVRTHGGDRYILSKLLEVGTDGIIVDNEPEDRVLIPFAGISSCEIVAGI